MEPITWRTEKRKVSELLGFKANPRKLTNKQRTELRRSLEKFGLAEIPAVDADNTILAGNQRVKTLIDLGRGDDEIDVRIPSRQLTEEERKEYLLRSNKNGADWDMNILLAEFDESMLLDVGFKGAELEKAKSENGDDESKEDDFEIPDMELKAFESWDYVVLVFKNTHDWLYATQRLGLKNVNESWVKGKKKVGLGRVIDGSQFIQVLDSVEGQVGHHHDSQADAVRDPAGAD